MGNFDQLVNGIGITILELGISNDSWHVLTEHSMN